MLPFLLLLFLSLFHGRAALKLPFQLPLQRQQQQQQQQQQRLLQCCFRFDEKEVFLLPGNTGSTNVQ